MNFVDRDLTCSVCGLQFVFSAGEQAFFRDKGFKHDPKRCKKCGASRDVGMRAKTQSQVKCAVCGQETTVPFKPTQNRPVLCRQCFANRAKTNPDQEHALQMQAL